MELFFEFLPYYLIFISLISVIVCIFDKHRARKHGWRVSENTLMLLSMLGGGVAMYTTMKLIHHKTLHKKFMVGIPLIILLHIIAVAFLYVNYM